MAASLDDADGVAQVHDLHLGTLTSGMSLATAHLVATAGADHQRYSTVHGTRCGNLDGIVRTTP
ncbi:hypothetical protein [Georgenia subflava]|uniref:hypothetical protein n=1 Tax=Georgenia subflava TaxID=1622177 RepID=UPI00186AF3B7|nr:hypothetical protein [Georgenia subflava]